MLWTCFWQQGTLWSQKEGPRFFLDPHIKQGRTRGPAVIQLMMPI